MKRVLLVVPPFYRLMGSHYNGLPLGIAYIAAILKQQGHYVKIYNADYQDRDDYADQRHLFESSPSYKAALQDLTYPIWSEIKGKIASFAPDILAITMLTANHKAAQYIAAIGKELCPSMKVIVGGAHPTLDPEGTIMQEEFDYVARGEGEFTLLELVEGKNEKSIQGLSWKKNGNIIHNEERPFIKDLDMLPFPCRDSFLPGAEHIDTGYVITGRGCPFSCSFCASPQIWHRTTRLRSIPNVMMELEEIKKAYNPNPIRFVDDTFNIDQRRTKEICRQIIERELNINWECNTRADRLDKELLTLMKEAGCQRIKIGVESGSNRILKMINKGLTKEKIRHAVALIKECEIPLTIYVMVGFPQESNGDLQQTIDLAKELDADYYSLSVLAPYYGTQIWSELQASGKIIDREHWEYFYHTSHDMIINDELDPAVVNEFLALNDREGKSRT